MRLSYVFRCDFFTQIEDKGDKEHPRWKEIFSQGMLASVRVD